MRVEREAFTEAEIRHPPPSPAWATSFFRILVCWVWARRNGGLCQNRELDPNQCGFPSGVPLQARIVKFLVGTVSSKESGTFPPRRPRRHCKAQLTPDGCVGCAPRQFVCQSISVDKTLSNKGSLKKKSFLLEYKGVS